MARAVSKKCSRCRRLGAEYFTYLYRSFKYDVAKARKLVKDGRDPVEVDEKSVRHCVRTNRIYKDHVLHVNPKYPGIIAFAFLRKPNGRMTKWHVLIDGNHRAARCIREKRPFHAYLLSEDESRAVLMRSPGQLRPGLKSRSKPRRSIRAKA